MFAKHPQGGAYCLADYGDLKTGAIVPEVNELYSQVEQWLSEGNTWQTYPEPDLPVPQSISARQARLALLSIGKLADVTTAIASMLSPDREQAEIEWEYATHIERTHPFVENLGSALNMTPLEIDDLFRQAIEL